MPTPETTDVARPLRVLVPLIKEELAAGAAAGLAHYRRAGEMLLEAKAQVKSGDWYSWLDRNFRLSKSTATRYMQLVERVSARDARVHGGSIGQALGAKQNPEHRASWEEPVRKITNQFNREAYLTQTRNREREEQLEHALGIKLIDIGYKVLATQLHPDKGGSATAMARLNRVRDLLKRAL